MNALTSAKKVTATRDAAMAHIRAVEMTQRAGRPVADPVRYFADETARIRARLRRERGLDPEGAEMRKIRDWMTTEQYFEWLEGVLAWQEAYLAAYGS